MGFPFGRPSDYVLVIGASHLDVIADYDDPAGSAVDKVGLVRYSIGGTAYNVSVTLAQHDVPVQILTALRKESFARLWISERLKEFKVGTRFVRYPAANRESGFVAIRRRGELENAVTSSVLTDEIFNNENLANPISRSRLVFADANLSTDQIDVIRQICANHDRPLALACVSDSKIGRVTVLSAAIRPIDVVFLNDREFKAAIGRQVENTLSREQVREVCARLHAVRVVATQAADGYTVFSQDGSRAKHPAPQVEVVESTTGAGDALAAAVVADWYADRALDFTGNSDRISQFVRENLRCVGATRGSLASDMEIGALARNAIKDQGFVRRYLMNGDIWKAIAAALTLVTSIVALVKTIG